MSDAAEKLNSLPPDVIHLLEKECKGLEHGVVDHFFDKFFDDDLVLRQRFSNRLEASDGIFFTLVSLSVKSIISYNEKKTILQSHKDGDVTAAFIRVLRSKSPFQVGQAVHYADMFGLWHPRVTSCWHKAVEDWRYKKSKTLAVHNEIRLLTPSAHYEAVQALCDYNLDIRLTNPETTWDDRATMTDRLVADGVIRQYDAEYLACSVGQTPHWYYYKLKDLLR
jgi:hypothetical protein